MALRFRRRIRIAPGVHLNLGLHGAGLSVGPRGFHVGVIRVHDLRHNCASLLLAQGVSLKAIQEILGHSDIRITMNLYAHLYPEAKREAADKMDAILNPVATVVATVGDAGRPN